MSLTEIRVPDLGDFDQIEIIEVPVQIGDQVAVEDTILTLESDKAAMEIPAPVAGVVREIQVSVGDRVSQGDVILLAECAVQDSPAESEQTRASATPQDADIQTEVLVLGAGPGGYTAAFRAADLGKKVVLVERYSSLGGVCLNVGCIPSKALLHIAQIINEADSVSQHGVTFGQPALDLDKIRGWKNSVVDQLTGGLKQLAKQRKVTVVHGVGQFSDAHTLTVTSETGMQRIRFENAIIAAGSAAVKIPGFPYDDPRLIDSTGALSLERTSGSMLVIGGGIIGLEMATVYDSLGVDISVVELGDGLIPGCDRDLVRPLQKRIAKRYHNIYLNTRVTGVESTEAGLKVSFEGGKAPQSAVFDQVLVSVGRRPNGVLVDADKAGVKVDDHGFIAVDKQQRTNVSHIFAIGDLVGQPMLAHKAVHEAKVAAEVIAGHKSTFDALTIPSVAYTDPEIAWMGLSEDEAKEQGIDVDVGRFPWAASGRSLSLGRNEGMTKILFDRQTRRVLGGGIVGPNAGELISELVLALEMGADVDDLSLTIHPHPTLSETVCFAAEMANGTITDLLPPKKKKG